MITNWRQRLDASCRRFESASMRYRQDARRRLDLTRGKLDLLSPKSTLARGYSITRSSDTGAVVRSAKVVKQGQTVTTMVLDGEFSSVVT